VVSGRLGCRHYSRHPKRRQAPRYPYYSRSTDILWPLRGHHETHVFTFMAKRTRTCAKSGNRYERGTRYPISYQGWGTTFARTRRNAGVADFRIHDLRHTGATRTLRASKNLRAVSAVGLGTDLASMHFICVNDARVKVRYGPRVGVV
jgi:integrase